MSLQDRFIAQQGGAKDRAKRRGGAVGRRRRVQLALICMDGIALCLAFIALFATGRVSGADPITLRLLGLGALALLGSAWWSGLYPGYRLHHHEYLHRKLAGALTIAAAAGFATLVLFGDLDATLAMLAFLMLGVLFQVLLRPVILRILKHDNLWGEPVDILAEPELAQALARYLRSNWHFGLTPADGADPLSSQPEAETALIAADSLPSRDGMTMMRRRYGEIILLADVPQLSISGLRSADLMGEIGWSLARSTPRPTGPGLKRVLDLAVAVPALLLALPVVLLAGAAIWIADPGPIFYRQKREGHRGHPIGVWKLRTMYRDSEAMLQDLLQRDPEALAEWKTHFKLKKDPRILPVVGHLLRSSSLDELPQLFNVLSGDMSIVGPRPFPEYHLAAMDPLFRQKRASVMPGITGLWQVSERADADIALQQRLDEFYIDNRSFWLDVHILLQTFAVVLRRSGS
ncbi:hypothetical protein FGG78_19490 [Thioclava sp. BHET1]|nr:hypothetical protein FGG78_19490 [Thioclava sp. BHET1]